MSKGDTPPKITDSYRGDFNEIKNFRVCPNLCCDARAPARATHQHTLRKVMIHKHGLLPG
ncbi:MAG TPA: hypothetical protein PKH60_00280 [Candidatus Woesebacteria bacterium]|nr:hypothetical protein [Candidatus Woesebacteria bacterium]